MHFVALGVFAYKEGGTAAVGIAGLVRLLPAAIVAPFAASLGDRFPRERFLLVLTLLGAVALAASAAAAFAGQRVIVFALAAVVGLAATLFRPALQALLPSLAHTPEELIASNGATSTIEGLGTLVGPVLAGLIVAVADTGVVFAVGAGVLLAGASLLALIRVEGRIDLTATGGEANVWQLLGGGFRAVIDTTGARTVVGLIVAQTFVRGCVNVLIVVAVFRVFHGSDGAVGYLTAAIGVGGLVGALGAMTLKGRHLATVFGVALFCWGIPLILIAPRPYLAATVILLAVVGAANSLEDVAVFTLLQRLVPDETLTRVLGLVWGLAMGGVALGSIAAPAVVELVGPRPRVRRRRLDPPAADARHASPARRARSIRRSGGGARVHRARPDLRAALTRSERTLGGAPRPCVDRGRRARDQRGRRWRSLLHRRRRRARHRRRRAALLSRSWGLFRRDRAATRRPANRDGHGNRCLEAVRARARRLPRGGHRTFPRRTLPARRPSTNGLPEVRATSRADDRTLRPNAVRITGD